MYTAYDGLADVATLTNGRVHALDLTVDSQARAYAHTLSWYTCTCTAHARHMHSTCTAFARHMQARVVGLDISRRLLSLARKSCDAEGCTAHCILHAMCIPWCIA